VPASMQLLHCSKRFHCGLFLKDSCTASDCISSGFVSIFSG
jgi:hypothetical protein